MTFLGTIVYFFAAYFSSLVVGKSLPKKYSSINGTNLQSLNLLYGISVIHSISLLLMLLRIPINIISLLLSLLIIILFLRKSVLLLKHYKFNNRLNSIDSITNKFSLNIFRHYFFHSILSPAFCIFTLLSFAPFALVLLKGGIYISV